MFHKEWFTRKGNRVNIRMDTNLPVNKPVFIFSFDCGNDKEAYAEMLKDRLNEELGKAKIDIAEKAWYYLGPYQISELKKKLRDWDSKKECWK